MSATIWAICGAGSKVGKTTLALLLQKKLANSIYIKCGHGKYKNNKPGLFCNTLTELKELIEKHSQKKHHIIVESNKFVLTGGGDVKIFLEAKPDTKTRSDAAQLENIADIKLDSNADLEKLLVFCSDKKQLTHPLGDLSRQRR